jgi:membrane protease YdiL (CAAX protease family)
MLGGVLPWDFALILLVLGVAVPWRGAARVQKLLARPELATADRLGLYASTIAFQWAAAAIVAWRSIARGLNPAQLGIALPQPELALATSLALCFLFGATQIYSLRKLSRLPPERRGFLAELARKIMPHSAIEALAFVALATSVAICEEFLYRGFIFTVVERLFRGSAGAATLVSAGLFALAHLYQRRPGLASTFVVGLIFAGARIFTGSLAPSIVAHMLTDLIAGLGAWRLTATEEPKQIL